MPHLLSFSSICGSLPPKLSTRRYSVPRVTLRRIGRSPTSMAEMAPAEVYPAAAHKIKAVAQTWRALVNWLGFLLEIVVQILRGTPSWAQILFSASPSFKPLGSEELPTNAPPPPPLTAAAPFEKLTVVLDLDETLVCAYETSSLPTVVRSQAVEAGIKCFELECTSTDKEVEGKSKTNHVTVFERPGLREFLRQIDQFADLVLFTAGVEGYARPLVDRIDVEDRFSLRLYRPSTVSTGHREHVKDLSCLSKDLCRIVIVDNNPFSFLLQPLNGIPCVPFTAGQLHDEQLMGSLLPLLKHLSLQKDVRPVLYETFHMPEWFEKHGFPSRH